jgi:hypothetical protein
MTRPSVHLLQHLRPAQASSQSFHRRHPCCKALLETATNPVLMLKWDSMAKEVFELQASVDPANHVSRVVAYGRYGVPGTPPCMCAAASSASVPPIDCNNSDVADGSQRGLSEDICRTRSRLHWPRISCQCACRKTLAVRTPSAHAPAPCFLQHQSSSHCCSLSGQVSGVPVAHGSGGRVFPRWKGCCLYQRHFTSLAMSAMAAHMHRCSHSWMPGLDGCWRT